MFGASINNQIQLPVLPALPNPEDVVIATGHFQICDFGVKDEDQRPVSKIVFDPESKSVVEDSKLVKWAQQEVLNSKMNPEDLT